MTALNQYVMDDLLLSKSVPARDLFKSFLKNFNQQARVYFARTIQALPENRHEFKSVSEALASVESLPEESTQAMEVSTGRHEMEIQCCDIFKLPNYYKVGLRSVDNPEEPEGFAVSTKPLVNALAKALRDNGADFELDEDSDDIFNL
ncbi:MAG: hypothetical protein ACO1RX_19230 [Candidatus Sericytochromatia bacterium]